MRPLNWAEIVRLKDDESLTFDQIAERLGKKKGSVYNAYKRAKAPGSKPSVYQESKPLSKPIPQAETGFKDVGSKPPVYSDSKLESLLPDLEEIVSWWSKRKQALSKPVVYPTRRQTYILAEDLIAGIKLYAEKKGISITEAVNEVIRRGLAD